jgi:methylthioribose-1-phosphate isomerase
MKQTDYFSIKFENGFLEFLDQTKLPLQENYIKTDDYERIAEAIEKLEIRGAPLIGVAAAYALALAFKKDENFSPELFNKVYERLASTRPTAVNLFYALDELKTAYTNNQSPTDIYNVLLKRAKEIHKKDIEYCARIGKNGLAIFKTKSNVLTHCNTGRLATAGDGTAFNVIKTAFQNGLVSYVYADETRPLLQGSRLTAFELDKSGIPFSIQTDSSAAVLMQQKKINLVITGADRIALNGDSANKIGTYTLAVLAYQHDIPFYIAAPTTTIDRKIASGNEIKIEQRNKAELFKLNDIPITNDNYSAFTPAFDVTPSHLIKGIITEEGVFNFPYNFLPVGR